MLDTKLLYMCDVEELRAFTERSVKIAVNGSVEIGTYIIAETLES